MLVFISVSRSLKHAHDAGGAAGREAEALELADRDQVRAERERLQDIRPAEKSAVDDDLGATANGLDDLRQHVDRTLAVVELATAMVRHVDALDAVLDAQLRILGGRDALEGERHVERVLEPLDQVPGHRRLVVHAADAAPGRRRVALDEVALAPAVEGGIDGEAERLVAVLDRAPDVVLDPRAVAPDIELVDLGMLGPGRNLL